MLALLLAVSVLFIQVTGSHFHLQTSSAGHAPSMIHAEHPPSVLRAKHTDTHTSCAEARCEVEGAVNLTAPAFLKKLDSGWESFAPAILLLLVWPVVGRGARLVPIAAFRPAVAQLFLRPLLRAPPADLVPSGR